MLEDAGRGVVGGEQDVGERLVVPHQHVEARPQALDQIGFQQQRFGLGAGDHEFHRRGLAHHPADAVGVEASLRVVGDALLQAARLADIEHVAGRVHHAVDAGRVGQPLDEFLDDVGAGLAVGIPGRIVPFDLGEGDVGACRRRRSPRRNPLPRPRGPACSRQCRRAAAPLRGGFGTGGLRSGSFIRPCLSHQAFARQDAGRRRSRSSGR